MCGVEMPSQNRIEKSLDAWQHRIVEHFPDDFLAVDCFGFDVTRGAVKRYLQMQREHWKEVILATLRWSPGNRVAEVGVAYGQHLLLLAREFGFSVSAFELPVNIDCYCQALKAEGIAVVGCDLHGMGALPMSPDCDFVICSEVVEHLFVDIETTLNRLSSLVRLGGRILLTTPNIYRLSNLRRMFHGYNLCERHPRECHCRNGVVVDSRTHPREYTMFEIAHAFGSSPNWRLLDVRTCLEDAGVRSMSLTRRLLFKAVFRFPMKPCIFAVGERVA